MNRNFFTISVILIVVSFIVFWVIAYCMEHDLEKIGTSFGIYSGLFSALAFLGVLYALYRQSEDNQKRDIDNQKRDVESQYRDFENHFFQLLQLHQTIKQDILKTHPGDQKQPEYKNFFAFIVNEIENWVNSCKGNPEFANKTDKQIVLHAYQIYYDTYTSELGHYFRNLYYIYQFVDRQSQISIDKKQQSMRLLRSQLNNSELILVGLNSLIDTGKSSTEYLSRFKIVKNINRNSEQFKNYFKFFLDEEHFKLNSIK